MVRRQLLAPMPRSASVNCTCMSFSASAKVEGETSGPTSGPVPKAGGSPGGRLLAVWAWLRRVAAAPRSPNDVVFRNRLRDLDVKPPSGIRRGQRGRVMAGRRSYHAAPSKGLTAGHAEKRPKRKGFN